MKREHLEKRVRYLFSVLAPALRAKKRKGRVFYPTMWGNKRYEGLLDTALNILTDPDLRFDGIEGADQEKAEKEVGSDA